MNERIKELVKQAGFFVLSNGKIYIPTTSEEITDCQTKFAELIVKECLLKANGAKIRGETINELIERIKDDFGVE